MLPGTEWPCLRNQLITDCGSLSRAPGYPYRPPSYTSSPVTMGYIFGPACGQCNSHCPFPSQVFEPSISLVNLLRWNGKLSILRSTWKVSALWIFLCPASAIKSLLKFSFCRVCVLNWNLPLCLTFSIDSVGYFLALVGLWIVKKSYQFYEHKINGLVTSEPSFGSFSDNTSSTYLLFLAQYLLSGHLINFTICRSHFPTNQWWSTFKVGMYLGLNSV